MYARLVVPAGGVAAGHCMRDIGRLITDAAPSVSDLSGSGYSTSTSFVLDNTPAGWTYVGSNQAVDRPELAGAGAANAVLANYCFSAPMADYPALLKYAIMTQSSDNSTAVGSGGGVFALTGATLATATGTVTNEGYRTYTTSTASANGVNFTTAGGETHHVIANARHITIIQENKGMMAIWETSMTENHELYNKAAFVQYWHPTATATGVNSGTGVSSFSASSPTPTVAGVAFNTQAPSGTFYGGYTCTNAGNLGVFIQNHNNLRANTVDQTGNPRYQISPIFLHNHLVGQAVQYVTGVVPIYWCKAGIGSSGDTVNINDEIYTYFNCGTTANMAVLLKTS